MCVCLAPVTLCCYYLTFDEFSRLFYPSSIRIDHKLSTAGQGSEVRRSNSALGSELPWDQPSESCQEYSDWLQTKTYLPPWKKIQPTPLSKTHTYTHTHTLHYDDEQSKDLPESRECPSDLFPRLQACCLSCCCRLQRRGSVSRTSRRSAGSARHTSLQPGSSQRLRAPQPSSYAPTQRSSRSTATKGPNCACVSPGCVCACVRMS